MTNDIGSAMADEAVRTVLQSGGIGVLGLAAEGRAYTFPIAFAYDPDAGRCVLRFVSAAESKKREFLPETETASLTVYRWEEPTDWHSVVINGSLEPIADEDVAHAGALFSDVGAEAGLDVFNRSLSAYDTEWYELVIEDITGRQAE